MAKSITARKSEVLRFIDTHGYALYCLINQINRNSSITNSHHIQKIMGLKNLIVMQLVVAFPISSDRLHAYIKFN